MKKYFISFLILVSNLWANQYDYLLFSNVLSDVESGIKLKADVNARNETWKNTTPLYQAVKNNQLEIAYLLIMAGADVNAINNGESALHMAARNKNAYLLQLLIMAGAKVNMQDEQYGNTPLHYAADNGDTKAMALLTANNADMNIANFDGVTPTQLALLKTTIPPISLQDLNLAVSASAFKLGSGGVIFNVRNLTNEPLTIFYTGLYVNGVLTGERRIPLTIPPGTIITNVNAMNVLPNGAYAIKPDKNGRVDIKAGFSIDYQTEGEIHTLFDSTQLNFQLWNPSLQKQPRENQKEQAQ